MATLDQLLMANTPQLRALSPVDPWVIVFRRLPDGPPSTNLFLEVARVREFRRLSRGWFRRPVIQSPGRP